jgi:hypothetical protein
MDQPTALGCLTPTPLGWLLKEQVWLTTRLGLLMLEERHGAIVYMMWRRGGEHTSQRDEIRDLGRRRGRPSRRG